MRIITARIVVRGFRDEEIVIVTSLLDPVRYPKEQILEWYLRRWEIEVSFSDMKTTLRYEFIRGNEYWSPLADVEIDDDRGMVGRIEGILICDDDVAGCMDGIRLDEYVIQRGRWRVVLRAQGTAVPAGRIALRIVVFGRKLRGFVRHFGGRPVADDQPIRIANRPHRTAGKTRFGSL